MLKIEEIKDDVLKRLEKRSCGNCLNRYIINDEDGSKCCEMSCQECHLKAFKMLLEEVKEKYKLTQLEYELLKHFDEMGYAYIKKEKDNVKRIILTHKQAPNAIINCCELFIGSFEFLPVNEMVKIKDILNNCVVVKGADEVAEETND